MREVTTAVVTVVHGRGEHLRRQARSLAGSLRAPGPWVVVAMDDPGVGEVVAALPDVASGRLPVQVRHAPASPAGLPLAAARNLGGEVALAEGASGLVFLDVDCLAAPGLVGAYGDSMAAEEGTLWSGPVTYLPPDLDEAGLAEPWRSHDDPHPARPAPPSGEVVRESRPELFWSLSFAVSAAGWRRSGGFCEEYVGYGGEDTDFALQATGRGLSLAWLGSARAYHQHHPVQSARPERVEDLLRNGGIFARRWGWWPMQGWFEELERAGVVRRAGDGWERRPDATT